MVRCWPSRLITKLTCLPSRRLAQHAAKLLHAFDRLAVHLQNHVMHLQSGLARRAVVIHTDDLRAARLFQLQLAQSALR